jgi:hypothetical protein
MRPASKNEGSSMPNIKKKGYSARDLRDVSDNPELTKQDFAKARPLADALPDLAAAIRKAAARTLPRNLYRSVCPVR